MNGTPWMTGRRRVCAAVRVGWSACRGPLVRRVQDAGNDAEPWRKNRAPSPASGLNITMSGEDLLAQKTADVATQEDDARSRKPCRVQPSAQEISRMEEAICWPVATSQEVETARIVQHVALARSRDLDMSYVARKMRVGAEHVRVGNRPRAGGHCLRPARQRGACVLNPVAPGAGLQRAFPAPGVLHDAAPSLHCQPCRDCDLTGHVADMSKSTLMTRMYGPAARCKRFSSIWW